MNFVNWSPPFCKPLIKPFISRFVKMNQARLTCYKYFYVDKGTPMFWCESLVLFRTFFSDFSTHTQLVAQEIPESWLDGHRWDLAPHLWVVRPQMETRFSGWKRWLKNNPGLVKSSPWHPRKIGHLHHINSNINFQPKTGNVKGSWPII